MLWLEAIHAHLVGHGRQAVSQVPGWDLVGQARPEPYRRVTQLLLGRRIVFPVRPAVPKGAHTGTLLGAIRFGGGPRPLSGHPSAPPAAGIVVVFDTHGRPIARFHVKAGHYFRLRLVPGRYLLIDDLQGLLSCGDIAPHVHATNTLHVTIPIGCGIV